MQRTPTTSGAPTPSSASKVMPTGASAFLGNGIHEAIYRIGTGFIYYSP